MGARSKPLSFMRQRQEALLGCGYLSPLPHWARVRQLSRLRRPGNLVAMKERIGVLARVSK
jgi:hypothetical protein